MATAAQRRNVEGDDLITVDETAIAYGLDGGRYEFDSYYTHPCPDCGKTMRSWGTSGDFSGNSWQTWKCLTKKCLDRWGCFSEKLPTKLEIKAGAPDVLAIRYSRNERAHAARVGREPRSWILQDE